MGTDMGGFAQTGGSYLVDQFGRRMANGPQILVPCGYRRVDVLTAAGGENIVLMKGFPVAGSISITVNGSPVSWTLSGKNATLTTALTSGQMCCVDYMAVTPNPGASVISGLDSTAISIYASLLEWFEMDDTFAAGVTGSFAGILLGSGNVPSANFKSAALRGNGGGHSINFSGGGYYVSNLTTTMNFSAGSGISMFGWFKSPSLSSVSDGNMFGGSYTGEYGFAYNYAGGTLCAVRNASGSYTGNTSCTTAVAANTATHCGYTLDFTSLSLNYYINGSIVTTVTISSLASGASNPSSIEIGDYSANPSGRSSNGSFQDIVFCNKALSSTEAAYLYKSGQGISYSQLKANSGH